MSRGPMDDIRAIVLTYGAGGGCAALLEDLRRERLEPGQVLIVHNPSVAGEAPPPAPDGVEWIAAPRNLGYAGGVNLGIRHQLDRGADLLLVLTHDTRLRPGALEALAGAARRNPSYGVLGPALVHGGTDEPFSFGGALGRHGGRSHLRARPRTGAGGIAPCDWVDGGAMLFRAELLRRIDGFEERFFLYCEDTEICLRARRAGAGVCVVPDALAEQAPGGMRRPGAWAYLMTRNGGLVAYRARGPRGLAAALLAAAGIAGLNLARVAARGLRLRRGSPAEPLALATGTAAGALALLTGRWGPPPPWLPGSGDVGNA